MELSQALNEARKMANFFKAFEKLDEVAHAVVEGQQLIGEITSRKTAIESEYSALKAEKVSLEEAVRSLKAEHKELQPKVEFLEQKLDELKRKLS